MKIEQLEKFYKLWWEFLKRSERYKIFCATFGDLNIPLEPKDIDLPLLRTYKFFGDVFRESFQDWWWIRSYELMVEDYINIPSSVVPFDVDLILDCLERAFDRVFDRFKDFVSGNKEWVIKKEPMNIESLRLTFRLDLVTELGTEIDIALREIMKNKLVKRYSEEVARRASLDGSKDLNIEDLEGVAREVAARASSVFDPFKYQFLAVDYKRAPARELALEIGKEISDRRKTDEKKTLKLLFPDYYDFLPPMGRNLYLDYWEECLEVYDCVKGGKSWEETLKEAVYPNGRDFTDVEKKQAWRRYKKAKELIRNVEQGFLV